MKIVVNRTYGGFSVSQDVIKELNLNQDHGYLDNEDFGIKSDNDYAYRANEKLIAAIEKIGLEKSAGDNCALLQIIEIPEDIKWYISNYDGIETVHEEHRSW